MAKKTKLSDFHITTKQSGEFHFFTQAPDHKVALLSLFSRSSDFKNIVRDNQDMTIEIKVLKDKPKKKKR